MNCQITTLVFFGVCCYKLPGPIETPGVHRVNKKIPNKSKAKKGITEEFPTLSETTSLHPSWLQLSCQHLCLTNSWWEDMRKKLSSSSFQLALLYVLTLKVNTFWECVSCVNDFYLGHLAFRALNVCKVKRSQPQQRNRSFKFKGLKGWKEAEIWKWNVPGSSLWFYGMVQMWPFQRLSG